MDSTAPLIPGQSAAGIVIGSPIEIVLKDQKTHFLVEEVENPFVMRVSPPVRYRSAMVDLWVEEGIVNQIMVHNGYSEDNLVILNLPGLCFEVEGYFSDLKDPSLRQAPIKEIYIFNTKENLGT